MRWWGWGPEAAEASIPDGPLSFLQEQLGALPPPKDHAPLEQVRIPSPALTAAARRRLQSALSAPLRDDPLARISHAAGKSYPDLVRMRAGEPMGAPDAVAYPRSAAEVAEVLAACVRAGVAVVPFGGGTSVVGGVEPLRGPFRSVVSLDLSLMDRLLEHDRGALTARLEPGISGPAAEAALNPHGLTIGHFPQSFEYATVGGWVATRSAGQASTGYGRVDENVLGLQLSAPAGTLGAKPLPASAAGPDLRQLVIGSEGALGVITEVTVSVHPAPEDLRYEGWRFDSFAAGREALRLLEQAGHAPDVARLSDEEETRLGRAMSSRSQGEGGGCAAVFGWEGSAADVSLRRRESRRLLRACPARSAGERAGRKWLQGRYAAPYLRDLLMRHGVMVETLETAATWDRIDAVYEAVRTALHGALSERGGKALVMCHVSHLYRSGASLYFTFLAAQEQGREIVQWHRAKSAACDALVASGGTLTHHHAVGADHAPWMEAEVGHCGVQVLRAAKDCLDPAGIMNPGKLLP